MKIIKIEIKAFGTLKNFVLKPKDNLLSICEHNGYGKSTICNFICAMLYGIPIIYEQEQFPIMKVLLVELWN